MAHIFELAESLSPPSNYVDGVKTSGQSKFPATEVFQGFNRPSRIEGDVHDLEVTGQIPADIDGTFFRIQPDHRFPPLYESDIHFNGDGNVTAIRISGGEAHFKQRYVHTDRYDHETRHKKALFGKYRNPYTDNEAVKGVIRTAANTNIFFWRGMLLATKEDGPAYAMEPETLNTIGRYDFEGQVLSPTMTAHPKFDPKTGEMICYGYEVSRGRPSQKSEADSARLAATATTAPATSSSTPSVRTASRRRSAGTRPPSAASSTTAASAITGSSSP
jgi:carotenoid cleavage dioxygenase